MSSMCSPTRKRPYSSWLDVMCGDKSFIDPRTLEVHRVLFNDPTPQRSLRHHLPPASPRHQYAFVVNWVETTTFIMETKGFDPVPYNEIDDDEEEFLEELQQPLLLVSYPPFPRQNAMDSLLGLQNRRHRKIGFNEQYEEFSNYPVYGNGYRFANGNEHGMNQAQAQPYADIVVSSSSSSSCYLDSDDEGRGRAKQIIASKVRRACQVLRGRLT